MVLVMAGGSVVGVTEVMIEKIEKKGLILIKFVNNFIIIELIA